MSKASLYVRRSVVALVIIAAAVVPAWAASDKIIGSYPSPTKYPYGLAYGAGTLYLGDSVTMMIYRLEPDNGSIMGSYVPSPKPSGNFMYGLAYSAGYLWATTRSPARLFKITPTDGSVVGSFGIATASASTGVAADANYIYVANNDVATTQMFKYYQTGGSLAASWPGAKYPDGATVIRHVPTNRNVVLNLGNVDGWVYIFELNGTRHDGEQFKIDAPCGESHYVGDLAMEDSTHIFFASSYLKYIYQHEIDWGGQEEYAVKPYSFGKIKALYR
jgi:outer membrane protein assembly factor BamB